MDRESVALSRALVAAEPAAHTADLAKTLGNLATAICEDGDHDKELRLRAEGVAWLARLAHQHPDEAAEHYRRARSEFAQQCSQHDREPTFALHAEQGALHELAKDAAAADTS